MASPAAELDDSHPGVSRAAGAVLEEVDWLEQGAAGGCELRVDGTAFQEDKGQVDGDGLSA